MNRWIPIASLAVAACASAPTPAESHAVTTEGEEQAACVAKYDTKEAIDACRNQVRAAHGRAPR